MLPGPLISTMHLTCLNRLKIVRRAASDLNEWQFLRSSAIMKWYPFVSLDSRAFMACLERNGARKLSQILSSQQIGPLTLYFFLLARDFIPPNPACRKAYFSTKVEFISSMAAFSAEYCSRPLKVMRRKL